MRRNRKVKILATLGPASSDEATIARLHLAGADAFRINMSHTDPAKLRMLAAAVRAVEARHGRPIGILVDLQGPKIRIGAFARGPVMLEEGQAFTLDLKRARGDATRVTLPHRDVMSALSAGDSVLIDDGKLRLRVTAVGKDYAETKVEVGGRISDRKGVSLPDTTLHRSALTEKDRVDLDAALEVGADWIALSFIQRPEDLAEVKKVTRGRAGVLAKIEKPQALTQIDAIIDAADALMVARGDLGVEMPLEAVPGIQKQLTRAARRAGKPVVVATQMLESMITAPVPTRAEVSDVATAVFEGADAVMLSAESAAGAYPVDAVATMNRIAEQVERDPFYPGIIHAQRPEPEPTAADAISVAARQIAETVKLAGIVVYTTSGATGMRIVRERPLLPVIALSPIEAIARRLAIVWGLHCVVTPDATGLEEMVSHATAIARNEGFADIGQRIIITAGVPLGTPGATNLLRIAHVTA